MSKKKKNLKIIFIDAVKVPLRELFNQPSSYVYSWKQKTQSLVAHSSASSK